MEPASAALDDTGPSRSDAEMKDRPAGHADRKPRGDHHAQSGRERRCDHQPTQCRADVPAPGLSRLKLSRLRRLRLWRLRSRRPYLRLPYLGPPDPRLLGLGLSDLGLSGPEQLDPRLLGLEQLDLGLRGLGLSGLGLSGLE